jgi:hypothetical protein
MSGGAQRAPDSKLLEGETKNAQTQDAQRREKEIQSHQDRQGEACARF